MHYKIQCPSSMMRAAITLVELLVTIAIIGMLTSLLLPAVQMARESARNTQCQSQLRQVGLAVLQHESTFQHLPSGGWGFSWVGDVQYGFGKKQPGGWIFQILPHLEQTNLVELSRTDRQALLMQRVPVLVCPSRSGANPDLYLGVVPLRNATIPVMAFKSDYAGNGGDRELPSDAGPEDDSPATLSRYRSPHTKKATGLFFQFSAVQLREISDGLSNTYLVGEKCVQIPAPRVHEGRDLGNDQAALIGDDHDIRRWTQSAPRADMKSSVSEVFGSSHPSGWNVSYVDGSVRQIAFGLDREIHRALGNRADGSNLSISE